jgi:tetratricopeptide (TPR) repeat protein
VTDSAVLLPVFMRRWLEGGALKGIRAALLLLLIIHACGGDAQPSTRAAPDLFITARHLTFQDGRDSALRAAIPMWHDLMGSARQDGRTRSEGAHAGSLGFAFAELGEYDSASHYLRLGIAIADRANHHFNAAGMRLQVGDLLVTKGDSAGALREYRTALGILDDAPEPDPILRARAAERINALGGSAVH